MKEQRTGTKYRIAERLRGADLRPHEHVVRKAILKAFADTGKAPGVQELAYALGLPLKSVLEACRTLAASDLIVWKDKTTHIVSAYPFSGVPTAHRVRLGGQTPRYAMCAIDALGIPFMLGQGAHIHSVCFFCHQPVTVDVEEGLLHRAHPTTIVVWDSDREGNCVAEARCPLMNFFCNEEHLQEWQVTSPQEWGARLSLAEALEVGKAALGTLLA